MKNKTIKRLATFVAVLVCLFAFFSMTACVGGNNEPPAPENVFVFESGDSGLTVVGISETATGDVVIPETYDGKAVTAIAEKAFEGSAITGLVVPKSVKTIGSSALRGCRNLASLTVPFTGESAEAKNRKSLFGYIFGGTEFADSMEVVQSYGADSTSTFYLPRELKTITYTGETIVYGAFSGMNKFPLAYFHLSEAVKTVCDNAFDGNNFMYFVIDGNDIAAALTDGDACGKMLSTDSAVCLDKSVTQATAYVTDRRKSAHVFEDREYDMYLANKRYVFEAEDSIMSNNTKVWQLDQGGNGVPTSGGYYVNLNNLYQDTFYEYHVWAETDCTVGFVVGAWGRSAVFGNLYTLKINGVEKTDGLDVFMPTDNTTVPGLENYPYNITHWSAYEICDLTLKAGENVIRLDVKSTPSEYGPYVGNSIIFDYIALDSYTVLRWA